jgi:hypothetical protein
MRRVRHCLVLAVTLQQGKEEGAAPSGFVLLHSHAGDKLLPMQEISYWKACKCRLLQYACKIWILVKAKGSLNGGCPCWAAVRVAGVCSC